jgi:hypothetical protein
MDRAENLDENVPHIVDESPVQPTTYILEAFGRVRALQGGVEGGVQGGVEGLGRCQRNESGHKSQLMKRTISSTLRISSNSLTA